VIKRIKKNENFTDIQRWKYQDRINEIIIDTQDGSDEAKSIDISIFQSANDKKEILRKLSELKSILLLNYRIELKQHQETQIKEFIQRRCEDLLDNQKRMLDSIMDREVKTIVIDRLITIEDGKEVLITRPKDIMRLTNTHFQHVAGTTNQDKELNPRWRDQYRSKDNINDKIYEGLMDLPMMDKLEYHIRLLPNGKATGPSKISYKMIKHLSIEMKTIIKELMTDCFRLQQIPSIWKLANVYPIPKPKPWCCDLSNTRPITLLDTVRKLMVSILNRRCGKILKDNKILKGNQFAGLPESSTFEPV
jgi:hypothetical protein